MRTLIWVMLIGVLSLFYSETASAAEITIDGETIHVETSNYKVQFDYGAITYLHNKLTNETYTLPLEPIFEVSAGILGKHEDFWARGAHTVETHKINPHTTETRFQEGGNEIRLVIAVDPNTGDLLISGDCVADTPGVAAIQWGIDNLNLTNLRLIVPSEKRQVIDATVAIDRVDFRYPTNYWEAQLAIIESEGGGFYLRSTDTTFQFKNLFYKRHANKFSFSIMTENQAPWDTLTTATSVTWRLNTYVGDWCVPAQMYRDWMEGTFNPWRLSGMPPWVKDIGLVMIHDRLDKEILKPLAELVDPTTTLLYLSNWRKYLFNFPDYTPHEKFEDVLETARQYGFRVMLHASLYDVSPTHPLYLELKRFQYQFPRTGELSGWNWEEIDAPDRYAYISLASSRWRNYLVQQFKAIWEKYNVDAFHLDVSSFILNDANGLIEGLTSAEGNVLMHKELAQAMPGVVFSGEGLHEVTFFRESFAQRRGEIMGPHHPLTAFLFSPYTRFYGGLDTADSLNPTLYPPYLENAESQGYLTTHWVDATHRLESPQFIQQLSVARRKQELGLQPNINCDWSPNTLFQYTTQIGETVTYQRKPSGSVFILPNDGGYERVFNVTQAQTHRSLPHWRAYNETHLLGLDPNRYYVLDNAPRDFSQVRVNSLSPDIRVSETRVTDEAAFFRFDSTGSDRGTTIGFFLPTPPVKSFPDTLRSTGSGQYTVEAALSQPVVIFLAPFQQISSPYNLRDAQYTAGLQFDGIFRLESHHESGGRWTVTIDNIDKEGIFALPPPDGQTVLQFPLSLPQAPSTFSFSAGLEEGCSKGVLFQVLLNGQSYFETVKDTFDWMDGSISLSTFAGQSLLLELVTDPAEEGSVGSDCDWAYWADLHITAAPNPDANQDGRVNVLDLIVVASSFNEQPPGNPLADTNKDGVVNLFDLVFVVEHLSQNAAAPSQLEFMKSIPSTAKEVIAAHRALKELESVPNKSVKVKLAIQLLRHYLSLADRNVKETKLLPNYPNPFNPDTWIPYQLSESASVTVKIYDIRGRLIKTIDVGHKPGGYYLTRERAVYWDGRNKSGEPVSSGVYFYTLITDDYTQTRRMVIVK